MDGRPKRKRPFFKMFLLLLLVGAVVLNIFVFRHADDVLELPGPAASQQQQPVHIGKNGKPQVAPPVIIGSGGPSWHGEARVVQKEKSPAEVTISPIDNTDTITQLTSYQVYISKPGDADEEEITGLFSLDKDGNLKGEIKDRAAGPWQLRIRLHRALSTFEFTQNLDLK